MNLVDELHAAAGVLRAAGVRYAVCGGIALTIHGATRVTKLRELCELTRVLHQARKR